MLRVESKTVDVEPLIDASGLQPLIVYRKGQQRFSLARASLVSGFNVNVSHADPLEEQVREAVDFLERHAEGLERLRRTEQVVAMTLDFALHDVTTKGRPWPSYRLPVALIELAGKNHLEIDLSFYS